MNLTIDARNYEIQIERSVCSTPAAPRLVVVSYLPNQVSRDILSACLNSIRKYTSTEYELWVVDNHSPAEHREWLAQQSDLNIIYNHTSPDNAHRLSFRQKLKKFRTGKSPHIGSYANAIALEIAARVIDKDAHYFMPLHMDTMPCHPNWLNYLLDKMKMGFAGAGFGLETKRLSAGVLHVFGYLVDFQVFQKLNLSFLPEFPLFDVGDKVTFELRRNHYDVFACKNTKWEPAAIEGLPPDSPYRKLQAELAFDDVGNILFLHLGRGIRKSKKDPYTRGATSEDWLDFANRVVLAQT